MMESIFLKILGMSATGSIVILITMLARFLLKKRSKRFIMILWTVVAVRLLVPIGFDSQLSIYNLIPLKTQTFTASSQVTSAAKPDYHAAETEGRYIIIGSEAGDTANAKMSEDPGSAETLPDIKTVLSVIWLAGSAGIAGFSIVRYFMLRKKLENARNISGNVYVSEKIGTPFVFGLFAPRIYLPDILEKTEKEYILLHERTHIKHGDWLIKIIGMAVVAVHWFNPLVWIAYMLFIQDIEMNCDESVVAGLNDDLKKAYTMSIVSYAMQSNSKRYLVTPLGFSKVNFSKTEVTNRVKNIINYKKGRTFTALIISAALIVIGGACIPNSTANADEAADVTETAAEETKTTETPETTTEETKSTETSKTTVPSEAEETSKPALPTEPAESTEDTTPSAPAEATESNETEKPAEATVKADDEEPEPEPEPEGPRNDYDLVPGAAFYAKSFVGIPYVKGGYSEKGLDNEGLVMYIYQQLYSGALPHDRDKIMKLGVEVSKDKASIADIVCYGSGDKCEAIAFCIGNGKVVYASEKDGKVVCADIDVMKIISVRHVVEY